MLTIVKNIVLNGADNRPIALDISFNVTGRPNPVLIYAHGFNGFKDWGNFDLIAEQFTQEGFTFIKFNFSHNGTTPEQPEDFVDLEAFGQNNYTRQLKDLQVVIDWICNPGNTYHTYMDINRISLIGHSMGGGISILYASEDPRIKRLVTWAAISECKTPWANWSREQLEEWKTTGVQYYANGRTGQQMPLYYQLYEDYTTNIRRLNIERSIKQLAIPILICHGTNDTAVPIEKARLLKDWQPHAQLFTIDSDHVFGRKHPWTEPQIPPAMQEIVVATLNFLKTTT